MSKRPSRSATSPSLTSSTDNEITQLVEPADAAHYMRLALAEAEKAVEAGEVPVGCVIVHRDKGVIATGHNRVNEEHNATRHAELVAADSTLLRDEYFRPQCFAECDVFVTCEPCIMCADALRKLSVRHVFFGCHNEKFGGCGSILNLHEGAYGVTSGVMQDEAVQLFKRFYSRENERAPEPKRKRKEHSSAQK
jgi:tRNA-specific adenosine deaminase 2